MRGILQKLQYACHKPEIRRTGNLPHNTLPTAPCELHGQEDAMKALF